jgi:hypothetical protein
LLTIVAWTFFLLIRGLMSYCVFVYVCVQWCLSLCHIIVLYVLGSMLRCPYKTMFGSFLPLIVWRGAHIVLCYFCLFAHSGVQHMLTIWVTLQVSYKRQQLIALRGHLCSPLFLMGPVLPIFFSFLSCVLYYFVCFRLVYPMLPVSLDCPF